MDFHNSQIMADAELVDPETRRTVPVITTADLIDKGAEGGVRDLLGQLKFFLNGISHGEVPRAASIEFRPVAKRVY